VTVRSYDPFEAWLLDAAVTTVSSADEARFCSSPVPTEEKVFTLVWSVLRSVFNLSRASFDSDSSEIFFSLGFTRVERVASEVALIRPSVSIPDAIPEKLISGIDFLFAAAFADLDHHTEV
jgi:hypothetical protein